MTLSVSIAENELLVLAKPEFELRAAIKRRDEIMAQWSAEESTVKQLVACGQTGNTDTVAKLTQARTRLEMFPAQIQEQDRLISELALALRAAFGPFPLVFSREALKARIGAKDRISACLVAEGIPAHQVELLLPDIISHSDTLKQVDACETICSPVQLIHYGKTPQQLLTMAARIRGMFDLSLADE